MSSNCNITLSKLNVVISYHNVIFQVHLSYLAAVCG